jgi:hypothetical protein
MKKKLIKKKKKQKTNSGLTRQTLKKAKKIFWVNSSNQVNPSNPGSVS